MDSAGLKPCARAGARSARCASLAVLAIFLLALQSGCSHLQSPVVMPRSMFGFNTHGTNLNSQTESPVLLQEQAERFADHYALAVAQAMDNLNMHSNSLTIRIEAARWKLAQGTAAFVDATGANPVLNGLDLVVLATVSRMAMENEMTQVFGAEGEPLLAVHHQLETNAWNWAEKILTPAQQKELRELILEWQRNNPDLRFVAVTRLRELVSTVGRKKSAEAKPSSLLGLLYLDPFASLDPTTAAIVETRQTAERAMFYVQRMPMLLDWQVRLATLQITDQPEARQLLGDAERLSRASEAFADLARQMPQLVNDQRKAAIQQVLAGLASERTNWQAFLNSAQEKAGALLGETRQTLNAVSQAADAVNGTVKSLDEFVHYVSPPQTNQLTTATNQHPFDVRDYGAAASQIGAAAQDLNTVLLTLNQSAPALSQQISANAKSAVDRAFWLGLALLLILLAGLLAVGWICFAWRRGNCQPVAASPPKK